MTSEKFINSIDIKKYFNHLNEEDIKRAIKRLKDDRKKVNKGNKRKFFVSKEYINIENIFDYMMDLNSYIDKRLKEEIEISKKNLMDDELARKAGWYNKKELKDDTPLLKWADQCYPNLDIDLFECEFELELISRYNREKIVKYEKY